MGQIVIIGAGPAGIIAALQAVGVHAVTLIDLNDTVGRKLAATGAGRGNLSNRNLNADMYNPTKAQKFVQDVLANATPQETLEQLERLGIYTYATDDGWIYPVSNSASNVSELLDAHLRSSGVRILLSTRVINLVRTANRFSIHIEGSQEPLAADAVLLASGGKAAPQLGADMDILQSIARLGHTLEPVLPALAPITTAPKPIQKLQGVRMDLTLSLFDSKARLGRTTGNAIFTQWGLNGPAAMNLSHLVQTSGSHDYWLSIDFLPGQSKQLRDLLREYQESEIPLLVLLKSILPPKVARLMVDKCDIPAAAPVRSISRVEIEKCFELMTSFRLPVTGVRGFEYAQLSTGGVAVSEVDSHSMVSRKVRGLYFAGEILNVHGPCGGFNLQWAFSSGMVAGKAMAALTC